MTTGDTEATPVDEVLVNNLIPRVVAAFNAHDADGFTAVMTEDVVFDHSVKFPRFPGDFLIWDWRPRVGG